jgi:hypothetical protein
VRIRRLSVEKVAGECLLAGRQTPDTGGHTMSRMRVVTAVLGVFAAASLFAGDVSDRVTVSHSGFGRNRATGVWSATITVTNKTESPIDGPIQVVLTKLAPHAKMVNGSGMRHGSPYITVTTESLAPGESARTSIQFTTTSNDFITFAPLACSGCR